MDESRKRPGTAGLAVDLLVPLTCVLVVNGLVFGLGWDSAREIGPGPALSGPLVGTVWVLLFTMMGAARRLLKSDGADGSRRSGMPIVILMASCLLWPFYTLAIGSEIGGLIGNLWTIALASFVAALAWGRSRVAMGLILPVSAWVALATILTYSRC